jgi:hypothetical protein
MMQVRLGVVVWVWGRLLELLLQRADAPATLFVQLWSFVSEIFEQLLRALDHFARCHSSARVLWSVYERRKT